MFGSYGKCIYAFALSELWITGARYIVAFRLVRCRVYNEHEPGIVLAIRHLICVLAADASYDK